MQLEPLRNRRSSIDLPMACMNNVNETLNKQSDSRDAVQQ